MQTGPEERGCKLLIPKGGFWKGIPTPLFCQKRLEVIENKGRECEKERQEAAGL